MPRCGLTLLTVLSLLAPAVAAESDTAEDEDVLRAAHLPTDGSGLLAFFRKRTPNEQTRARIEALVEQLGSDSFSQHGMIIHRKNPNLIFCSHNPQPTALKRDCESVLATGAR